MPETTQGYTDIPLGPGNLQQQLSVLPESQLQQIINQANNWAAFIHQTQMMEGIARDMKEIPELPSEVINSKDSNQLTRVEFPKEGGVLTFMDDYDYPFQGYPFHGFVDQINFLKKISRSMLSGLYHELKRRHRIRFLTLLPGLWFGKDAVRAGIYVWFRAIERFRIKKERYCLFIRELHRAFSIERPGEKPEEIEFRQYLRDTVCMLLEFDNAYRFRAQDILPMIDKKKIIEDTAGEIIRLLRIMMTREIRQEVRDTWRLFEYTIKFYLRFDRRMQRLIAHTLFQLDIDKIKLQTEDKAYCVTRSDYKFGFMNNPTEEDLRLIKIKDFRMIKWESREKTRLESTKAHTELAERHRKEQEELTAIINKPTTENMTVDRDKLFARQLAERQALDNKYNKEFEIADAIFKIEKDKLKI